MYLTCFKDNSHNFHLILKKNLFFTEKYTIPSESQPEKSILTYAFNKLLKVRDVKSISKAAT